MTTLTPKQEAFAQAYMQTGSASEAYRTAYDASKSKPESVHRLAYGVLENVKVASRIKELQNQAQQRHQLTVDDLLSELEEARQVAMGGGDKPTPAAMVAATMGKAKLLGYLDRKPEVNEVDMAKLVSDLIDKLPG